MSAVQDTEQFALSSAPAQLLGLLQSRGRGRGNALPAAEVSRILGCSVRVLQVLVSELIEHGELVGSSCEAGRNGFFLIEDLTDLEEGTRHIRSRALSSLQRVGRLRRAAERRFTTFEVQRLFDLSGSP